MSDKVLVTGAAGFTGQHLVNRLVANGHEVTAVDIRQDPPSSFADHVGEQVDYIRGSVIHKNFIDSVIFQSPNYYDRVFHLAAIVGVDRYIDADNPLHLVDVNVNGTRNILDRLRGTDTHFIYTSTSEVYGKNEAVPWNERSDQVLGPPEVSRWSYSATKTVCEHMIHMMDDADPRLRTTVVRPFNLYGPYQRPKFVVPKFVEMVLDGESPTVYNDGTQQRCFTYVEDYVDGLVAASNRSEEQPRTYNLGGTDEIEIGQLARMILDLADSDLQVEYIDPENVFDGEYEEPPRRIPDTTRAREQLHWEPTTPIREGLQRTIESMRSARQ